MRKIIFALALIFLAASLTWGEEVKKEIKKPMAPMPRIISPTAAEGMKIGLGTVIIPEPFPITHVPLVPSLKFYNARGFSGEIGLGYDSLSGNGRAHDNQLKALLKGDFYLFSVGKVSARAGLGIFYQSITNYFQGGTNPSYYFIFPYWGFTSFLSSNVSLTADLSPLAYASGSVGNTSTNGFVLGTAELGIHYYF